MENKGNGRAIAIAAVIAVAAAVCAFFAGNSYGASGGETIHSHFAHSVFSYPSGPSMRFTP